MDLKLGGKSIFDKTFVWGPGFDFVRIKSYINTVFLRFCVQNSMLYNSKNIPVTYLHDGMEIPKVSGHIVSSSDGVTERKQQVVRAIFRVIMLNQYSLPGI